MRSTLAAILIACLASPAVRAAALEPAVGPIARSVQRQGEQLAQASSDGWTDLRQRIGTAVLVRDSGGGETFGRLIDVTDDALTVSVGADTRSVLKTNTCDVSLVRRDRSAAVGWIAGLTLGGLATGIVLSKSLEGVRPAPFVFAGAGLGALIGMNGTHTRAVFRRAGRGCRD